MARKKITQKQANKKYKDGTTYTVNGKKRKRKSYPKGSPKQRAYCARSAKQKQTKKVKARRKAWKC